MLVRIRRELGENPPGAGIVLQVIEHPVHLVKFPLRILVLDAQLVAIGLANGAVRPGPFVPDVAAQIRNAVGFLLPNPQQLIHSAFPVGAPQGHNGEFLRQIVAVHHAEFLPNPQQLIHSAFPVGAPQGHNGEFLRQIVAVHHAEFFDGMGRGAVLPVGAHLQIFVGKSIVQNVQTCLPVQFICLAHATASCWYGPGCRPPSGGAPPNFRRKIHCSKCPDMSAGTIHLPCSRNRLLLIFWLLYHIPPGMARQQKILPGFPGRILGCRKSPTGAFRQVFAVCCAHNLSAHGEQISHLQPDKYFRPGTRPGRKWI